jgi:acyl carrier protein
MVSRQELLQVLCDAMEISSEDVTEETVLEELGDAWDSVNRLSIISIIDTYGDRSLPSTAVVESKTVGNLIDLVCEYKGSL